MLPNRASSPQRSDDALTKNSETEGKILFLCSPRVSDLKELAGCRLYLSDMPLHDATRDLMLLDDTRANQHSQIVQLEDANTKLNNAHSALARAHSELAKQKELTDKLLYSMFPVHVAIQLKQNKTVVAETFSSVTILFSDIAGFTAICAKCHPSQVISMLDQLYKEFDAVTWENELYKVDSILYIILLEVVKWYLVYRLKQLEMLIWSWAGW